MNTYGGLQPSLQELNAELIKITIMQYRALSKAEQFKIGEFLKYTKNECLEKYISQIDSLYISKYDLNTSSYRLCCDLSKPEFDGMAYSLEVECSFVDMDGMVVIVDILVDGNENLVELELWKPTGNDIIMHFAYAKLNANS